MNALIRRTLARRLERCAAKERTEGYEALASLDAEIAHKLRVDADALEGKAFRSGQDALQRKSQHNRKSMLRG
jgi:hypothetical protein